MNVLNYIEESVVVQGKFALKGTLTVPQSDDVKFPAVLIISGSGMIDRNGNALAKKIELNIYKELAELITKKGFISLRYDKRGVGQSEGNYYETGMWDLVDDVNANIEYLKAHPKVDVNKIILLGHSEGCMLATIANSINSVNGLILLSGAAENLEDAMKRQRELLYQEVRKSKGLKYSLLRILDIEKKSEKQNNKFIQKVLDTDSAVIKQGFAKINAKWLREHFTHDVLKDLEKAKCPVLAITGSKDFQTTPECVNKVSELVKGDSEAHIIENMSHILKESIGEISILNYKKQYINESRQTIHPQLETYIANWLNKHFQKIEKK